MTARAARSSAPWRRQACIAVLACALVLPPTREARADWGDGLEALVVLLVIGVTAIVAADITFTAYDVSVVAENDEEPESGWMGAQVTIAGLQTLIFHSIFMAEDLEEEETGAVQLAAVGVLTWPTMLTAFSAWSLANQDVALGPRFGVSWLVGLDLSMTTNALGRAFDGEVVGPAMAVGEMVMSAPQVALGVYQGIHDPDQRGAWISLAAWSGVIAVHGLVSLIVWSVAPPPEEEVLLPDPAPTPPPQETPAPAPPPRAEPPRPPLVVPAPITDGFNVVPGLQVVGRF